MHPVHVELSPGSEVKRRPVLGATEDRNMYLQRACRDAYYYHHNHHNTSSSPCEETKSETDATTSSAEVMLELELDAILQGGANVRQRSVHRDAVNTLSESPSPLFSPPPSLLTMLTSQQISHGTQKEEEREMMGGEVDVPIHQTHHPSSSSSPLSVLKHSGGSRTARQSVMRRSIDRFFSASEEREESTAATGDGASTIDASSCDRHSPDDAPPSAFPSPRTSPQHDSSGCAAKVAVDPNQLSLASVVDKRSSSSAYSSGLAARKAKETVPSSVATSVGAATESRACKSRALQGIPVNTLVSSSTSSSALAKGLSNKPHANRIEALYDGGTSPCGTCVTRECPAGSSGAQQLLDGAPVAVTCEQCHKSLLLFVFFPRGSAPCVRFCPLCGSGGVAMVMSA
jgi:hypothetical protein